MPMDDWHSDACEDLLVPLDAEPEPGAFILARAGHRHRVDLPRKLATRHVLILGPSGAGKTKGFFLGNCARARGVSLVAMDAKGELWDETRRHHRHTLRFAPREPGATEAFNWVPLCADLQTTLVVARALVGRPPVAGSWRHDAERALCAALFAHAATLPEPTPAAAYDLLCALDRAALFAALARSPSPAARRLAAPLALAGRALQGALALAVGARLGFLADDAVRRFTSSTREAVDLAALRRRPTATYWVVREDEMIWLRPLSSLFFALLLHQLKRAAPTTPVTLLLDEFTNLGDMTDFETEVTIARSYDIAFVLGVQSIAQIERVYGQANARTIYENCQTTVALAGLSDHSARIVARSVTPDPTVTEERPRLTGNDLRELERKEMLAVIANRPPLRLRCLEYEPR